MVPETFPHHEAVHAYAKSHGLEYVWQGTAAFEKRKRTLAPEQFQILTVHTRNGMTKVLMFSKEIIKAEAAAFDTPLRRAKRAARLHRIQEKYDSKQT
jgi:hypothetical protein